MEQEARDIVRAETAQENPLWDTVWKRLDADSLARDFPDAKRELAALHGRGIFAPRGSGLPIDELADSLKTQGYLPQDADSSTLVEALKNAKRNKYYVDYEMNKALDRATHYGTGFTQDQSQKLKKAQATRREQGERFEQGHNEKMSIGNVPPAEVMGHYFRPGTVGISAAQDFKRAFAGDSRAMAKMKDYVLRQFLFESTQDGKLSLPKMEAFFKRYDGALRQFPEIEQDLVNLIAQQAGADALASSVKDAGKQAASFGKTVLKRDTKQNAKLVGRDINEDVGKQLVEKGLLSAVEVERLKALTRSANRASRAMELAKVHGSPTSQNLATQEWMSNILGDNVDRQGGILNALLTVPFNPALKFLEKNLYGDTSQVIQRHLAKAMVDPEYAKKLLTLGKDASNTTKALQWLFGTGVNRNLKGAGDILKDTFKAQANVQLRGLLDLMGEDEPKKKK